MSWGLCWFSLRTSWHDLRTRSESKVNLTLVERLLCFTFKPLGSDWTLFLIRLSLFHRFLKMFGNGISDRFMRNTLSSHFLAALAWLRSTFQSPIWSLSLPMWRALLPFCSDFCISLSEISITANQSRSAWMSATRTSYFRNMELYFIELRFSVILKHNSVHFFKFSIFKVSEMNSISSAEWCV